MQEFIVHVADRQTGRESQVRTVAASDVDAAKKAMSDGWMVSKVEPAKATIAEMPTDRTVEYKVLHVRAPFWKRLFSGGGTFPVEQTEASLNEHAARGWRLAHLVPHRKTVFLFFGHHGVVITFIRTTGPKARPD